MKQRGDDGSYGRPGELPVACVSPDTAVELEHSEDKEAEYRIEGSKFQKRGKIIIGDLADPGVKPYPEGYEIGKIDRKNIIEQQKYHHILPMLQLSRPVRFSLFIIYTHGFIEFYQMLRSYSIKINMIQYRQCGSCFHAGNCPYYYTGIVPSLYLKHPLLHF